jgi:hypothetical protein
MEKIPAMPRGRVNFPEVERIGGSYYTYDVQVCPLSDGALGRFIFLVPAFDRKQRSLCKGHSVFYLLFPGIAVFIDLSEIILRTTRFR